MQTEYAVTTNRLWQASADPDGSVHNQFDIYAEVGNFFSNTASGSYWICKTIDGLGVQSWMQWPPQFQVDWNQSSSSSVVYIKNKPTLSTVATSGSYNDLSNKPSIPASQVNSDW